MLVQSQKNVDSQILVATKFLQTQKIDSAIAVLATTINTTNNLNTKQQALQLISTAYKQKGNTDKAINYLKEALLLKDSSNQEMINSLKSTFEIEQQTKELAIQKEKNKNQQLIIGAITISSILLLALLFLVQNSKQNKLKNTILEQQNLAIVAVLAAEEKERKRIARDLHDGVGQLMSAAKMNLSSLAARINLLNPQEITLLDKTLALVDESCKEVRSVSHNMMPNALLKTGLSVAIKSFLDKLDHKQIQVSLHTEGLEDRLPDNIELVLYRVIQEIVTNVIKHAQANKLDIALIKDKDGLSCTIEDNGIGFNKIKTDTNQGIGLQNIEARIAYLKGTAEWDSTLNKGTLVAIHVPTVYQ